MTDREYTPETTPVEMNAPAPVRALDPHQAQYDPNARYSAEATAAIRKRQASRSIIVGALLFGLCVMFFGITLAKIGYWG
jgi:hypothetical protein